LIDEYLLLAAHQTGQTHVCLLLCKIKDRFKIIVIVCIVEE